MELIRVLLICVEISPYIIRVQSAKINNVTKPISRDQNKDNKYQNF